VADPSGFRKKLIHFEPARPLEAMKTKNCSVCGTAFSCGRVSENQACWCSSLPPIMPFDDGRDCRCPSCLKAVIQERIESCVQTITPENAVGSIASHYLTNGPLLDGIDYRMNPQGLMVLTKWYLLKRGRCCENGCANCPYGTVPMKNPSRRNAGAAD
jgi:hypothetical protein